MPRSAKICQANFRSWPILSTPGSVQQRLERVERGALRESGRRSDLAAKQPATLAVAALPVRQRHIAGFVRRDRERKAAQLRLHRIADSPSRHRCATMPVSRARSIQALSRSRLRTVSYLLRSNLALRAASVRAAASVCGVETKLPLRSPAGAGRGAMPPPLSGSVRLRRRRLLRGPWPASASGAAPPSPGERQRESEASFAPACPASRASASIAPGSMLANSATRRISAVEFHRLEEADQPFVVGLVHGEIADRHVELDMIVERDELLRYAAPLRRARSATAGASPA